MRQRVFFDVVLFGINEFNDSVKIATTLLIALVLLSSGIFAGSLEMHTDHKDDMYHSQDLTVHVSADHAKENPDSKSGPDCPHVHIHAHTVVGLVATLGLQTAPVRIIQSQFFVFLDGFNLQDYSSTLYRPPIHS